MGGEEDPKDGAAVAGAVFGAVFIYIVCCFYLSADMVRFLLTVWAGFLRFLRIAGSSSHARKPSRRDKPIMRRNNYVAHDL